MRGHTDLRMAPDRMDAAHRGSLRAGLGLGAEVLGLPGRHDSLEITGTEVAPKGYAFPGGVAREGGLSAAPAIRSTRTPAPSPA